jgi:transcriptional regulator with XRE-family HTH domain
MSKFDTPVMAQKVQHNRVFLKYPKKDFMEMAGLKPDQPGRKGRLPAYPAAALAKLDVAVNRKAARVEAYDSTLAERIGLARDYQALRNAAVAKALGVSRELVRRWTCGINRPTNDRLPRLADILQVPLAWLQFGGEEHLPADSQLGVRVGDEAMNYREQLYGMTMGLLVEVDDDSSEADIQRFIDVAVLSRPQFAVAARRAGGRWQWVQGEFCFAPWVPLPQKGLARRYWSDEVEAIIEEELAVNATISGAWKSLKQRCEAQGWSYPQKITLHKRLDKQRERRNKFGIIFPAPDIRK